MACLFLGWKWKLMRTVVALQVLQGGGLESPTKPKGRPKKNSIPSSEQLSEQERTRDGDRLSDGASSLSDANQEE